MFGNIRGEKDEVRAGFVVRRVLAANDACQFCKVVFSAQVITLFPFLSFLVHSSFAHRRLSGAEDSDFISRVGSS
jgi:hypothetical protein